MVIQRLDRLIQVTARAACPSAERRIYAVVRASMSR